MLISVCIPVKNSEWCLSDCLESLENQTIQPDEYLFCISPSQDKTYELITQFKKVIESTHKKLTVQIIEDYDDLGTGYARKVLTNQAKSEYICWIDADFILPENMFEALYYLESKYSFDGLEGETYEITTEDAKKIKKQITAPVQIKNLEVSLMKRSDMRHGFARHLLRRSKILAVGNFSDNFPRGQDLDLTIRMGAANVKKYFCKNLRTYHTGLLSGYKNKGLYKNTIKRSIFFKLFWKYGLKYIFRDVEGSLMFTVRMMFLGTLALVFLSPLLFIELFIWYAVFLSFISFFLFVFAPTIRYKFSLRNTVIQIGKCFGEVIVMIEVIKNRQKYPFGYGKKYLE